MDLVSGTITRVTPDGTGFFAEFPALKREKFGFANKSEAKLSPNLRRSASTCGLELSEAVPPTRHWEEFLEQHEGRLAEGMEIQCERQHLKPAGARGCIIEELYVAEAR